MSYTKRDDMNKKSCKKNVFFFSLVMLFFVFGTAASGCASDSYTAYGEPTVIEVLEYFEKNKRENYLLSEISIIKKYVNNEGRYFVKTLREYMWETELLLIEEKDGEIKNITQTGASGSEEFFDFDVIEISQGSFIAAYCASHAGNGDLALIPFSASGIIKYSFPAVGYSALLLENAKGQDYSSYNQETHTILGGKLYAEYCDTNGDDATDVILKGIVQIRNGEDNAWPTEYFYRQVYIYSQAEDSFTYSPEFSTKLLLTSIT